jgi:hypothetical protein
MHESPAKLLYRVINRISSNNLLKAHVFLIRIYMNLMAYLLAVLAFYLAK